MNIPTRDYLSRKWRVFAFSLISALLPSLGAQTTNAVSELQDTDEEVLTLSPFTVTADEDEGSYQATSTLAGSRVRTELRDVGSAIQVVTSKFLQDTNAKNAADLLVYTTNTEVAAQGGNFVGGGDGAIIADGSYVEPVPNTRVRGLAAADNVRDFFLTDIPWDSYNVGRVDLQRGPNSILFGIGSPAGIINSSINTAGFKNTRKVEVQVASFGSLRIAADYNQVLRDKELAIRVSGLEDRTKYRQNPAYRDDSRIFAALRYEPKAWAKNGKLTTIRANYEHGNIQGINPRLTPPIDAITPWFSAMNKATYLWQDANQLTDRNHPRYTPYLGAAGQRIWDGQVVAFNANSPTQLYMFAADVKNWPATSDASRYNTVNGSYKGISTYDQIGKNLRLPGWQLSPFKAKSLTDSSIFDFYNNLIEGANRSNGTNFDAFNINLSQTFLNNRLGYEIAYDRQDTTWDYRNFLAWDAASISVDVMRTFADGSNNPNLGRPMVIGGGGSSGSGKSNRLRESYRVTIFGEHNFERSGMGDGFLGKMLGRHVFTANAGRQASDNLQTDWMNWYVGDGYGPSAGSAVRQATRDAITLTYLGDSLTNATSASGLNLSRITALQKAQTSTIRQWDTVSRSFINYNVPIVDANSASLTDETRPYTSARKFRDVVDSAVLVWQAHLLDDAIVPMVGFRRDIAESANAGSTSFTSGIVNNFNDPEWRIPRNLDEDGTGKNKERQYNKIAGNTTSWSVVARLPKRWSGKMPYGMDFSLFYNSSSNFQPDASRKDVLGNSIPSPAGKTKDYGFTVSLLEGKIALKTNWYETSVTDATLSGSLGTAYLIGAGEAWGQSAAVKLKADNWEWPASEFYGTSTSGKNLRWEPPSSGRVNPDQPYDSVANPYTQAAIDAQYAIQNAAVTDWLAKQPPESFKRTWGLVDHDKGLMAWSAADPKVTGDTLSKGVEFELMAQPLKGWQVSLNASKTTARRINIGAAYTYWIEKRWQDYQGPMGDIRIWGGGNWALDPASGGTVRDKFVLETLADYNLALALNGSNVSELRPWRFNAVSNYEFQDGRFKGANLGLAYRWQDGNVLGYPLNATKDGYQVDKPFFGKSDDSVDFWVGQTFHLSNGMKWRIQLNVRNAFYNKQLIPVTVQPDGSPAAYRIPEPRTFALSNTFEF